MPVPFHRRWVELLFSGYYRVAHLLLLVCAISSRYYTRKSEIYPIAMHFAKHAAADALIDGWKSVELCQAYILMSLYAVPARRWEEDRSWFYTDLAIRFLPCSSSRTYLTISFRRIATVLNLHQVATTKPQNEKQEREILNKTRVWMICSNLDRSTATQFGKPLMIKEDSCVFSLFRLQCPRPTMFSIMRNAKEWYKKSQYNHAVREYTG